MMGYWDPSVRACMKERSISEKFKGGVGVGVDGAWTDEVKKMVGWVQRALLNVKEHTMQSSCHATPSSM